MYTVSGEAELSAHHHGFLVVPAVVADGAPLAVDTHLHTTFVLQLTSHQTQVSTLARLVEGCVCAAHHRVNKRERERQQ